MHTNIESKNSMDASIKRERLNYYPFDKIVSVTKTGKEYLVNSLDIPTDKIKIVYNGLNPKTDQKTKEDLRKKYRFNRDDIILIHIGSVIKRKGIKELLKSVNELTNQGYIKLKLLIVGSGPIDSFLSSEIDCHNQLIWMGFQQKEIVNELIDLSDIGILLSYAEQCSYSLIEMMRGKLPLIATSIDGPKEMLKNNYNGYKIPIKFNTAGVNINTGKVTSSLKKLIDNEKLRDELGQNSYQEYTKRYLLKDMGMKTLALYKLKRHAFSSEKNHLLNFIIPIFRTANNSELSEVESDILTSLAQTGYSKKSFYFIVPENYHTVLQDAIEKLLPNTPVHILIYNVPEEVSQKIIELINQLDKSSLININLLQGYHPTNGYKQLCDSIINSKKEICSSSSSYYNVDKNYSPVFKDEFHLSKDQDIYLHTINKMFNLNSIVFKTEFLQKESTALSQLDLSLWTKLIKNKCHIILKNCAFALMEAPINKITNTFNSYSLSYLSKELNHLYKRKALLFEDDIKMHIKINYDIGLKEDDFKARLKYLERLNLFTKN